MAIMDAWEAGLGKPSLGSKSLALQPMRATVPTGDRLVFFVAFTEGGGVGIAAWAMLFTCLLYKYR